MRLLASLCPSLACLISWRRFTLLPAPSGIRCWPGRAQGLGRSAGATRFIRRLSATEVRSDWPSPEPGPRSPLLERGEGEEAARVTVRKRVSL